MNLFQLVFKQMRQRALGTWLTLLSVTLGVALAVAIMVLYREAGHLFGQTSFGYEVIVGKQGSATQLVMNTVYHVDQSVGNIPYSVYESMLDPQRNLPKEKQHHGGLFGRRPAAAAPAPTTEPGGEQKDAAYDYSPDVKIAIPIVVGDTYRSKYRIVATTTNMFGVDNETHQPLGADHVMPYRPEDPDGVAQYYEFAQGQVFAPNRFQAVIGSEVARRGDLAMGSDFQATHGEQPVPNPDVHPEHWTVVGVLKPTHTSADTCVFIPILTDYTIGDHELGLKTQWILQHGGTPPPLNADPDEVHAYKTNPDGTFELYVPKTEWEVSAILVKTRTFPQQLIYKFANRHDAMAVSPATTMREFFDRFLKPSELVLLVVAFMVSVVAAVGILVSIYNSVAARGREIAVLRALGATRGRVLTMICTEALLIGVFGGIAGLLLAHAGALVASAFFQRYLGEGIRWLRTDVLEWFYLVGIAVVAVLAGFVPAAKAYRTPVATNLVAG